MLAGEGGGKLPKLLGMKKRKQGEKAKSWRENLPCKGLEAKKRCWKEELPMAGRAWND